MYYLFDIENYQYKLFCDIENIRKKTPCTEQIYD